MLCLFNSSLSNTSHHSFAHHHSLAVNNESTFFKVIIVYMTTMIIQLARLLGVDKTLLKYIRNFVHSGTVMTKSIHFEYTILALIIVPIALIHSEYSKCMPTVITVPLCTKFLIDLAAPFCVCPILHSPILPIVICFILWQYWRVKSWTNTKWCCQVYEELCAQWNSDDSRHTL